MEKVSIFSTFVEGLCKLSEFDIVIRSDNGEFELYQQLNKYMNDEGREFIKHHTFGFVLKTKLTSNEEGMRVNFYLFKDDTHIKEIGEELIPMDELMDLDEEAMTYLARDKLYNKIQEYRA